MAKDPLTGGPESERVLFEEMGRLCNGRNMEAVLGACVNMICNIVRQSYGKLGEAEAKVNEIHGRTMDIVMQHYDPVTRHRRSVIKFDQVVRPPRFDARDNMHRGGNESK
jgi:hypothetical protein